MSAAAVDLDVHLPAIGAGDAAAFARWLAGAESPLRGALRSFARHCDTEGVVQETLLRVWQLAPTVVVDGKPNALLRFAHRIAKNLCIDEARRLKQVPLDEAALATLPADDPALPDPLLRELIARCRDQLPGKPALALALRLGDGGASSDVVLAERAGQTLNTFLQNFTRARKLLLDCLGKHQVTL